MPFTLHITDDLSGFAGGEIALFTGGRTVSTGAFHLVSGTPQDGIYDVAVPLPEDAWSAVSNWTVGLTLDDGAGNAADLTSALASAGFPNQLTIVDPSAPDPPTAVTALALNGSAAVSFLAPANDGGRAISGYTASCSSSDGGAFGSATGASSPIVVAGLTGGKSYACTASATNEVGPSPPSLPSNTVMLSPTISIGDASTPEGSRGSHTLKFAVTLSQPSSKNLTVTYVLRSVTATGAKKKTTTDVDFNDRGGVPGTLTFRAAHGKTPTTAFVSVRIYGDKVVEPNETFTVTLVSPSGGYVLLRAQAIGTILNDD